MIPHLQAIKHLARSRVRTVHRPHIDPLAPIYLLPFGADASIEHTACWVSTEAWRSGNVTKLAETVGFTALRM